MAKINYLGTQRPCLATICVALLPQSVTGVIQKMNGPQAGDRFRPKNSARLVSTPAGALLLSFGSPRPMHHWSRPQQERSFLSFGSPRPMQVGLDPNRSAPFSLLATVAGAKSCSLRRSSHETCSADVLRSSSPSLYLTHRLSSVPPSAGTQRSFSRILQQHGLLGPAAGTRAAGGEPVSAGGSGGVRRLRAVGARGDARSLS